MLETRARAFYFERFRGGIDGYEDYRYAMCILEGLEPTKGGKLFRSQLRKLKTAYLGFPEFNGRPLVDPFLPCMKMTTGLNLALSFFTQTLTLPLIGGNVWDYTKLFTGGEASPTKAFKVK